MTKMKDADLPLRDRIKSAIERVTNGQGLMRIPAEATDPDLVLFDCLVALDAARAREAKLRAAARNYMSQFGQALEANEIPYERYQQEADAALRAALAEGEDTHD